MVFRKKANPISHDGDTILTNKSKSNKSENNASIDEDYDDGDDDNLPSDYSIQAVVSYSDSNGDYLLENDDDDEHYYTEQVVTDDETDEIQKKAKKIHEQIIKSLSSPSKHRPQKATIHGTNDGTGGGDNVRGQDGDFGVDDDDEGDDILEKWRRKRRLEKLKMEHERKITDSNRFDELQKLDDILLTTTSHVHSNKPPIHPDVMMSQYHQFPIYYQQPYQSSQQQQFQPHQQQFLLQQQQLQTQPPIQPHKRPSTPMKGALISEKQHQNQPLKIHLHNVSKCCRCIKSPRQDAREGLPVNTKGGGDGFDLDPPTKDPGPLRAFKSEEQTRRRIDTQTQTLHDHRPSDYFVDDRNHRPRLWDLSGEIDKNAKIDSALESSLGRKSGSGFDKKVARSQKHAAIHVRDKVRGRSKTKDSTYQSQDDERSFFIGGRLKRNTEKTFDREMDPDDESSKFKNVFDNLDFNRHSDFGLSNDVDLLTYSFTTVSSLDASGDNDKLISNHVHDHPTPAKNGKGFSLKDRFARWLSKPLKGSGLDECNIGPRMGDTSNYYYRDYTARDDNAASTSLNSLHVPEPAVEVKTNSCGEVDEMVSELSDADNLLEISDGEEFPEDEILKGLREKRKECLRMIERFNKLLPP